MCATPRHTAFRRVLLAVAHPDDEAWMLGPLAAALREAGCATGLVCATNGERWRPRAGSVAPSADQVAVTRRAELARSCSVLEIELLQIPGLPDGRVKEHTRSLVTALDQAMDAFAPDLILTHGPGGEYGHPDHIAVHHAALEASARRAAPAPVAWRVWKEDIFEPLRRRLTRAGFLRGGIGDQAGSPRLDQPAQREEGCPTQLLGTAITQTHLDRALLALASHESQLEGRAPEDFPTPGTGRERPSLLRIELQGADSRSACLQ